MISLIVTLALTYFAFKFVLWLYGAFKDKEDAPILLINNSEEKIDPKPLNLPPDPKVKLSLKDINNSNDTNFKNLLVKKGKLRRNHISVSVSYV